MATKELNNIKSVVPLVVQLGEMHVWRWFGIVQAPAGLCYLERPMLTSAFGVDSHGTQDITWPHDLSCSIEKRYNNIVAKSAYGCAERTFYDSGRLAHHYSKCHRVTSSPETSKCGLMTIDRIQTDKWKLQIYPTQDIQEGQTNVPLQTLVKNFSKSLVTVHKPMCIALSRGSPNYVLNHKKYDRFTPTVGVNTLHFKEVQALQLEIEPHINAQCEQDEQKFRSTWLKRRGQDLRRPRHISLPTFWNDDRVWIHI